ncbi:HAD family acid phosphatase [Sphingomonas sp.]|uniref:HAD family acid phosphatase n=1 Tax=Sphingomonas sp. TaxID=28214 RepID=UPI0035BBD646
MSGGKATFSPTLARTGAVLFAALALASCATPRVRDVGSAPFGVRQQPLPPAAPAGMQYLYGSGEGGAMALTAMHALVAYATDKAAHRPADSVVLAADSPLVKATFVPCGDKPLAVVFDADETLIYNLGFEARAATGEPFDAARWSRWEQTGARATVAVPGAVHAVTELRKLGVTAVVNTNRGAANAGATAATLKGVGLGDFRHGDTLFLMGDGAPGSGKDARRAAIAARYCVIAMAGDQLGDFSDRFNTLAVAGRRAIAVHGSAAGLWGKGWFLLPNPVYGTALKGGVDDLFPPEKRWADAAEEKK